MRPIYTCPIYCAFQTWLACGRAFAADHGCVRVTLLAGFGSGLDYPEGCSQAYYGLWPPTARPWHQQPPTCQSQVVEAAEAKAYYGLATNYKALTALAKILMERESLSGVELREILEAQGAVGGWAWKGGVGVGLARTAHN